MTVALVHVNFAYAVYRGSHASGAHPLTLQICHKLLLWVTYLL